MFGLYGLKEVVRNLYCLAAARNMFSAVPSLDELRSAYLKLLSEYLPEMPLNLTTNLFVTDVATEDALVRAYAGRSLNGLDDMRQNEIISRSPLALQAKLAHARQVTEALEELNRIDGNLGTAFSLVIHSIFFRNFNSLPGVSRSYGGSSGGALGTIWLVPNDCLTDVDSMELLIHELTHHLLFLDELIHPQFDYSRMTQPTNFAHSAILRKQRPLDKVVHSIIVGTELLLWRVRTQHDAELRRTVHPHSRELLASVRQSLNSLDDVPDLDACLMPRTREILSACDSACQQLERARVPAFPLSA